MKKLSTSLVKQSGGLNLCGEACVAMCVNWLKGTRYTAKHMESRPNQVDRPDHLVDMARRKGVRLLTRVNFLREDVKFTIDSNRPVIVLISYREFPRYLKPPRWIGFNGGHYIVIHGYDDLGVWFLDPLGFAEKYMDWTDLFACWSVDGYFHIALFTEHSPLIFTEEDELSPEQFQQLRQDNAFMMRQILRRDNYANGYHVKRTGEGEQIGMYDRADKLLKRYTSETEYTNDGWRAWEDVGKKNWNL